MAYNLQSILGYQTLMGIIQKVRSGVPNPFGEEWFKTNKQCIGDSGVYTQVTGTRQVARVVAYGSPALARQLRNVAVLPIKLIHTLEKLPLDPLVLQQLRNYDNYNMQQLGKQELTRQTAEFARLGQNLRIVATALVLANGRLGADSGGNLLPDSSFGTAYYQMTFGVPAANTGNLSAIISGAGSWKLNSTDIPGILRQLKQLAIQTTGYELKDIWYGINIPSYITQNNYVIDYLARNPTERAEFLNSAEVGSLFGFTWHPVYTSLWDTSTDSSTNTYQYTWGNDNITLTPEVSADWWEWAEGSYMVPTSLNIASNAESALNNFRQVFGPFAYGMITLDPPGIVEVMGDTFLPVLKNGAAIFQANVTA